MKKTIWIAICLIIFGCSCTSTEEKHLKILMHELGIKFTNQTDSNYVVIIPGNGCGSCIQSAVNEMHESENTAYVFICDSEKDFYLQSGKQVSSFKNLYLDKNKAAFHLELVQTYPFVYLWKNGHLLSKAPYKSRKRIPSSKEMTTLSFDKKHIDLQDVKLGNLYKDSIRLVNTGKVPLYIKDISSSCDCTEVQVARKVIPISESEVLHITFRPEALGEFERYVYINCNVKEKELYIPIKGNVY